MSGMGVVWGIVKTAATQIPWGRVLEKVPVAVDLMGRARERFKPAAQRDLEGPFRLLQEENLKLTKALVETSVQLQQIGKVLGVLAARQKMLAIATVLSLMLAVSALTLVLLK